MSSRPPDVARTTLQLLALGVLIASSFWILRPFLIALTWAIMIAVATWPLLLHAQRALGGKRSLAVAVMTVALLLILFLPLYLGISALLKNAANIVEWSKSLAAVGLPAPPAWLEGVPVVGVKAGDRWREFAAAGVEEIPARLAPFANRFVGWFLGQIGNVGLLVIQSLLTIIMAAILYANGESAAHSADRLAHRLAGPRGEKLVHLAAQAIRSVALGVVVTAILQAVLAGIGLAIARVPFAAILTVAIFILAVAQIGAAPVLIGVVIWVYAEHGPLWGTGFLVWAVFCSTFDNVLRPLLIKRGAHLPLLLVFAGVVGGLIAFGVIGLFVGPVVLAVAYTLLVDWVSEGDTAVPGRHPSL
ncbi:MAG: AI-2E family transporter YdiK [Candidatus Binatia bacterium]